MAALGPETIGALSGAMAAIGALSFVQRLTGLSGRVTRILVTTRPGQQARVQRELATLAAGRLTVASADQDVALLKQAVTPNTQATGFFVLVSAIVGLLLAFNAMLLTVPERRRTMADLRMQGVRPWQLSRMLLFQAVCLGVVASLLGLAAGDFLSRTIFHATPSYLSAAFALGTQTVIGLRPLLVSFARRRAGDVPRRRAAAARPASQPRGRRRVLRGRRTRPGAGAPRAAAVVPRRRGPDPAHQRPAADLAFGDRARDHRPGGGDAARDPVRVPTGRAARRARRVVLGAAEHAHGGRARAARDDRPIARARGHGRDRRLRLRGRRRLPQRPPAWPLPRLLRVRLHGRPVGRQPRRRPGHQRLPRRSPSCAHRGRAGCRQRAHLPGRLPGLRRTTCLGDRARPQHARADPREPAPAWKHRHGHGPPAQRWLDHGLPAARRSPSRQRRRRAHTAHADRPGRAIASPPPRPTSAGAPARSS